MTEWRSLLLWTLTSSRATGPERMEVLSPCGVVAHATPHERSPTAQAVKTPADTSFGLLVSRKCIADLMGTPSLFGLRRSSPSPRRAG